MFDDDCLSWWKVKIVSLSLIFKLVTNDDIILVKNNKLCSAPSQLFELRYQSPKKQLRSLKESNLDSKSGF